MASPRIVRVGTGLLLWLAAATGATAVGMAAVGMIGSDILGSSQEPLTQAEVERRLASPTGSPSGSPSATGTPSPSATPSPDPTTPPAARPRVVDANGAGTITAQCNPDGTVLVLAVTPAQGYDADADDEEADDHPQIKFENDAVEVEVRLRCIDGVVSDEIRQNSED
ncbi:hypothetical protein E1262_17855 [Jiangella aurantiaca]|uniref:Septum formation initiator n=1 Tax=Jiangella aurantiaca TaxID=2530373 RepID=A0A4R5ADE1_9ACTN|nr:hypothetical protein [Jiangella aurantiaca]TDD67872.1 hypothetical protein E1262_17855 [Jiangella aurantiaca]